MTQETFTAQQIHQDFYGAPERAVAEAQAIIAASGTAAMKDKHDRLMRLGFSSSKDVTQVQQTIWMAERAEARMKTMKYWQGHYPTYKFIFEDEIQALCRKYGLLYGDASQFTGAVPEKNLTEIEKFKLRKEDYYDKNTFGMAMFNMEVQPTSFADAYMQQMLTSGNLTRTNAIPDGLLGMIQTTGTNAVLTTSNWTEIANNIDFPIIRARRVAKGEKNPKVSKHGEFFSGNPTFKICAPPEDFHTQGWEVREGYKLVWDPIVIQPVKDGGLIITAWGEEASDELVKNPVKN